MALASNRQQAPSSGDAWRLFRAKPFPCRRYCGFRTIAARTFVIILALAACSMQIAGASGLRRFLRADRKPSIAAASPTQDLADDAHPEDPTLQGTYEVLVGGLEAVWQLPPPGVVTQGVLLLTHGCGTSATLSWPRSASCTLCTGLPGSTAVSLTRYALLRGFAVVAVTSTRSGAEGEPAPGAAGEGCRQHSSPVLNPEGAVSPERDRLRMALVQLLPAKGLSGLPLFVLGLGHGAGGVQALELAVNPRPGVSVSGAVLVDPGRLLQDLAEHLDRTASSGSKSAAPMPPLLVLRTNPQGEERDQALAAIRRLHTLDVDVTEIIVRARPRGSQRSSQAHAGTPQQLSPEALLGPAEVGMALAWMEGQGGRGATTFQEPQQHEQQQQKEQKQKQKQADGESGVGSQQQQQQATHGGGGGGGGGGQQEEGCSCKCLDWVEACNLYLDSVINYNDYFLLDLDFDLGVQPWEAKQQRLSGGEWEWGNDKQWGRTQEAEEGGVNDTNLRLEIGLDGHLYLMYEEDVYAAADAGAAARGAAADAAAASGGSGGNGSSDDGVIRQNQQQQHQQQLRKHALRTSLALDANDEYYSFYDYYFHYDYYEDSALLPDPSLGRMAAGSTASRLESNRFHDHFHELLVKLAMTGAGWQGQEGELGRTGGGGRGDVAGAVEYQLREGGNGGPGGVESIRASASEVSASEHVRGTDLRDSRILDLYYLTDAEYYSVSLDEEPMAAAGTDGTAADDMPHGEVVGVGRSGGHEAVDGGRGGGFQGIAGSSVHTGAAAGALSAGVVDGDERQEGMQQEGKRDEGSMPGLHGGGWFWSAEGEYWQDYEAMHDKGLEDVTPDWMVAEHLRSTRGEGGAAAAAGDGDGDAARAGPRDEGAAGAGAGAGDEDGDGDGCVDGHGSNLQRAGDAEGLLEQGRSLELGRLARGPYHDYYDLHDQDVWDVLPETAPDAHNEMDVGAGAGAGHVLQSAGVAVRQQAES